MKNLLIKLVLWKLKVINAYGKWWLKVLGYNPKPEFKKEGLSIKTTPDKPKVFFSSSEQRELLNEERRRLKEDYIKNEKLEQ